MVCKEDVLSWFKDLEGYKRIDVLYELLNMCVPFELRFLGTCIEELGKHTYQELRGPAINANDLDRLSKDTSFSQSLLDENVRHRVLIYLSLLSSRNYSVANWLYKNVLRTDWLEDCIVKGNLKDEIVQSEFLLLFVMALHHPAFTFEQKLHFNQILSLLLELRESKKRISPKPSSYGYPPGFGYPTAKMNIQEGPIVPVKTSMTIPCGEDTLHQQSPGLPHVPPLQPHQEFVTWNIPGFACGAPDLGKVPPPFPMPPTVSPLVSESTSPNHSRSTSPHRTIVTLRSTPMPPPQTTRPIDTTIPTQLPIDPLSPNNFPFLHPAENVKMPDEDLNSIPEDKLLLEGSWVTVPMKEVKQPNGIRLSACPTKNSHRHFVEHFQGLSLNDGENSLHRSNSSSSSSLNQTPPETPAATPHPPQKARVNGMPFIPPAPGLPLCDTTSPPPPPTPTFNNCSVPYTTYQFTAIPTRSMFPYNQSYRPPFPHFQSYQTNENSFQTYSYMPLMFSSPFPPRNPNCYNCGAMGHSGQDCTGQNIEDITQKKTYMIEFAPPPLPDADK
ncbi:uncharacterized protein LOC660415 [Tribolium castaneum]|uniref:CCHC-type domain-containing protein n=1 Tax=Tribolium castaneum TaxID=7070 RepID=D6WL28_TRICA|nr:PREDICTED: verprolin [Tribolium castaneum]EFA04055.1 hypothetical protein TcasGA2_TC014287 [Tribolium castaneum]|eukprot:XP_971739.1 PREDICTED: verprolin [Tribolium castaneum]